MNKILLKIENNDEFDTTIIFFDSNEVFQDSISFYFFNDYTMFYVTDIHTFELKPTTSYKFIRKFFRSYLRFNKELDLLEEYEV